jgi:hypothetical protein
MLTCRRCFQRFSSAANSSRACSFHPALYTGGEVAKVSKQGAGEKILLSCTGL